MVIGSNVKLKAGGPTLTIVEISVDHATCVYWDVYQIPRSIRLPLAALREIFI